MCDHVLLQCPSLALFFLLSIKHDSNLTGKCYPVAVSNLLSGDTDIFFMLAFYYIIHWDGLHLSIICISVSCLTISLSCLNPRNFHSPTKKQCVLNYVILFSLPNSYHLLDNFYNIMVYWSYDIMTNSTIYIYLQYGRYWCSNCSVETSSGFVVKITFIW